jgi:antirestriction protein ArdC
MNVYDAVNERIIEQLDKGIIPWRKEWKVTGHSSMPSNFATKRPYRGINIMLLACSEFSDSRWLTYKQAQAIGAQVRKGERGTPIVFWSMFGRESASSSGDAKAERIPFLRSYTVFNVEQCDGIAVDLPFDLSVFEPIPAAQAIVDGYLTRSDIRLRNGGVRAYYSPSLDYIQMPLQTAFDSPDSYYSTLFHECGHSTGHRSRLDRKFDPSQHFGSVEYSKEELVAEFSAAYLCASVGISNERVETNHVAYIQGWLKALKNDKTLLVSAAQKAQRAADLISDRKFEAVEESAVEAVAA